MRRVTIFRFGPMRNLVVLVFGLVIFSLAGTGAALGQTRDLCLADPYCTDKTREEVGIFQKLDPSGQTAEAVSLIKPVVESAVGPIAITAAASTFAGGIGFVLQIPLIPAWTRRRAKPWGSVLDRVSGATLSAVLVRLFETEFGRLVASALSDSQGRFSFQLTEPGRFFVLASASGYELTRTQDFIVSDPRQGKPGSDWKIYLNPISTARSLKQDHLIWLRPVSVFLTLIRRPLLVLGSLVTLMALVTSFDLKVLMFAFFYLILWLLEYWQSRPPKPYGQLIDRASGRPVTLALIRAYRVRSNSRSYLAQTTVSNNQGQYRLLVAPGKYYFEIERPGYFKLRIGPKRLFGLKTQPNYRFKLQPVTQPLGQKSWSATVERTGVSV